VTTIPAGTIAIRPFRRNDDAGVVALLSAALGSGPAGKRPIELFRWKHFENPFGASFMLLAEAQDRIVGLRAFLRWRFTTKDREVTAVRAVDTATHPDYQGQGIFSKLTLAALDQLRGDVDLIFNTPNDKSLPGYLKMGWRPVDSVPVRVQVRRPVRFARRARSLRRHIQASPGRPPSNTAPLASEALHDAERLAGLLGRLETFPGRLSTPRTVDYLRWRYGAAPLLDYRAVGDGDALAIFRVRPRGSLWEATVAELLFRAGERSDARRLLRQVGRSAGVDHITLSFPAGFDADRALRLSAFRAPGGITLVTNPLAPDLAPDPTRLSSWALTLGDLEVF
jgi:GNAT superfamily N-acetyltransferase